MLNEEDLTSVSRIDEVFTLCFCPNLFVLVVCPVTFTALMFPITPKYTLDCLTLSSVSDLAALPLLCVFCTHCPPRVAVRPGQREKQERELIVLQEEREESSLHHPPTGQISEFLLDRSVSGRPEHAVCSHCSLRPARVAHVCTVWVPAHTYWLTASSVLTDFTIYTFTEYPSRIRQFSGSLIHKKDPQKIWSPKYFPCATANGCLKLMKEGYSAFQNLQRDYMVTILTKRVQISNST